MLISNGRQLSCNPMRLMGGIQVLNDTTIPHPPAGALCNQWIGFGKLASTPNAAQPPEAWIRAKKSGAMGTYGQIQGVATLEAYISKGGGIASSGIAGVGTIATTSDLSIMSILRAGAGQLLGLGTLSASMAGSVVFAAELAGAGEIEAAINIIALVTANILGVGTVDTNSDLRGKSSMQINITSAGELVTAQSCAAAVWSAIAAAYTDDGTMGKALASAGAAGDPWTGLLANYTDDATFGAFIKKLLSEDSFLALK
jgi:hypothetical protein